MILITLLGCLLQIASSQNIAPGLNNIAAQVNARNTALAANTAPGNVRTNEVNLIRNTNEANILRAANEANLRGINEANAFRGNEANNYRAISEANALRAANQAYNMRGINEAQNVGASEANFLRNANEANTLRASYEANALRNLGAAQINNMRTAAVESNAIRNSPRETAVRAAPNEAAAIRAAAVANGIPSGISGGFPGFLGQNLPMFNGGAFEVISSSPVAPNGLTVSADNLEIDGAVAVGGNLPFLGSAIVDGMLPAVGKGAVLFGSNSESFGIRDLQNNWQQSPLTESVNSGSLRTSRTANELEEIARIGTLGNIQPNKVPMSQGLRVNPADLNIGIGSLGSSGNVNNSPLGNFQAPNRASAVA